MSGNLLRAARLRAGLSQKALQAQLAARGVTLSRPTLSHYATGRRVPGALVEIVATARVLRVESQALLDYFADQRADHARAAYLEKLSHDELW
jgi:transcriptional regulator with XRE-family HTH domain